VVREALGRIDGDEELYRRLLPHCRLQPGEIWTDPVCGHRVGVLDATSAEDTARLLAGRLSYLGIHDPPYNLRVGNRKSTQLSATQLQDYLSFSRFWITSAAAVLERDAHFYVWLGADQRNGFQPLPDFMLVMREFPELESRSFITMRNQRGYGTQKNWMAVRQELLYYTKGSPEFQVVFTAIPRVLRGYYKMVNGKRTANTERHRSPTIRPGNVWLDLQQVFYRLEENVPGAYAQKPLSAIRRILTASRPGSTTPGEPEPIVTDFFSHAGTTLLACEIEGVPCYTMDIDPVFAELTIRRLEHYRKHGKTGWQWHSPFPEITPG